MFRRLFGARGRRRYEEGIELFNAGRLGEAIEAFEAVLVGHDDDLDPEHTLARFYRAECHARLGAAALDAEDPRTALSHLDVALADQSSYPDLYLQRGLALLALDDPLAAERSAREAIDRNPRLVEAGLLCVLAMRAQGDAVRAEHERTRWRELAANDGHPLLALFEDPQVPAAALLEHRAKQRARRRRIEKIDRFLHGGFWRQALVELDTLLEESPAFPDLRLRRAAALDGLGETRAAAAELEVAIARNPEFSDAHSLAAVVALRLGQPLKAREHAAKAHPPATRSTPVSYVRVVCGVALGEDAEARRLADLLSEELGPGAVPGELHALRALLHCGRGRKESARAIGAQLLGLAPLPTALVLDVVAVALCIDDLDLLQRAVAALPEGAPEPSVAVAKARGLVQRADNAGAIDLLRAALEDHPEAPCLWLELAEAMERREEGAGFLALWKARPLVAPAPARWRALVGRFAREAEDLPLCAEILGSDPEDVPSESGWALEDLLLERAHGEAGRALRLVAQWLEWTPLDPRWRIQDLDRWLEPLRPRAGRDTLVDDAAGTGSAPGRS